MIIDALEETYTNFKAMFLNRPYMHMTSRHRRNRSAPPLGGQYRITRKSSCQKCADPQHVGAMTSMHNVYKTVHVVYFRPFTLQ